MSYREVQILIDRGSWKKENLRFNPYWYIDQRKWYKNFDSFHCAIGLIVLLILEMVIDYLPQYTGFGHILGHFVQSQIHVIVYWVVIMQLRNLFMWLIYRK